MKCEVCHKIIPEQLDYCQLCNNQKPIGVIEKSKIIFQPKFCSNCGFKIEENVKFCSNCSFKLIKENIDTEVLSEKILKKEKSKIKSNFFRLILGAFALCVIIEIFLILTGDYLQTQINVISSALAIIAYGIISNISIDLLEGKKNKNLAVTSLIISVLGFIYTNLIIWDMLGENPSDSILEMLFSLWIISIGLAHSSKLILIKIRNINAKNILIVTNLFIFITYSISVLRVNFSIENELFNRFYLISIILTLFGTMATVTANKIK